MSSELTGARMSYAAALVASVGYGIYVVLFYHRVSLLAYTILLFALQTIYFVTGCKWSEIEFVESTVDPAIFASQQSSMLAVMKNTVYTLNIWVADAFILYRAYIVWGGGHYLILAPVLTYLGSLATGIGLLVEVAKPGGTLGQVAVINFGTPFWSLSVTTNILSTLLIAGRLTCPIFAESAALYALAALIYIPLFARNITLQYPFSAILGAVVSIAPTLIILRMAGGKAVTREWSNIPLSAVDVVGIAGILPMVLEICSDC
ncbi:hypothetical protein B0H19DRAFT_1266748 [Mycena capillaripes]|nr:hypothetical protein B0H19DRAFT_1266748 [Mycena capillaripes]